MEKTKILIASVLKPINDTRMYEKFGKSLSLLKDSHIHILGNKAQLPKDPNFTFYPIFSEKRVSLSRFLSSFYFTKTYIQVKPRLTIIQTHEFLLVMCLCKILFGGKYLYDIRENYSKNILFTNAFPIGIRQLLAAWVRAKEWLASLFIDGYLLAEKTYQNQLTFTHRHPTLLLENTCQLPISHLNKIEHFKDYKKISFLYSGTIHSSYGIFDAIKWFISFLEIVPHSTLTILGSCKSSNELAQLQKLTAPFPSIHFLGQEKSVDHQTILSAISTHDFGLMPYPFSEHTYDKMPTKFFEYIVYRLPIIIQKNPHWEPTLKKFNAGFSIDFKKMPDKNFLSMITQTSYFNNEDLSELIWKDETLNHFILKIMQK
jgi:glycosyltransferase involved in cell wall biosynthesis